MVEINPADPIEGILIGQLITAHEAALSMYQRAWQLAPEYFQARTKYLRARRQGGTDGGYVDRKARPSSTPGTAADRRKAQRRPGGCYA